MKPNTRTLLALLLSSALTLPAFAHDDDKHAPRKTELFKPAAGQSVAPATIGSRPPLIPGLGDFGMTVATASPVAQAFFDQGLGRLWGFNHAEAVRDFRAAQLADPTCAMCYWGEAYALGPNLNDVMHDEAVAPAWAAAQKALEHAHDPREVALAKALVARYAAEPGDRAPLNQAFADAMREVAEKWPGDANIQALFADALMNLQPWDYWEADAITPKGNTAEILVTLERAIDLEPEHPGALHLYIHAVEASADPGRAEFAADALRALVPAAGHLVHMPAHIYNRIGRYADSVQVNVEAVAADEAFLAAAGETASPLYRFGYYPHNVHFLLVAAAGTGMKDEAIGAAEKLAGITSDDVSAELAWVQAIRTAPYTAHAQFSTVEEILALPEPSDDFPFVKGFWHHARGLAFVRAGDLKAARAEAAALDAIISGTDFTALEDQYLPARDVLTVARNIVSARVFEAEGDIATATALLNEAASLEAAIPYMEPPYWPVPVNRTLGAVLLKAGDVEGAARAFEAALRLMPRDGWTLWGMAEAKAALGGTRDAEADAAAARGWLGDPALRDLSRL